MGQFNLNLSTRPFKPYRAVNLGLFILLVVLVIVSAAQVLSYQQYSALAANSRAVEKETREEFERLNSDLQSLNAKMRSGNAEAKLNEVKLLNDLLLRKSFSWTSVFANLERVMPENVRLISLSPFIDEEGRTGLNMEIRGRSFADASEFLRILEASHNFTDVVLAYTDEKRDAAGDAAFSLSSYYTPGQSKAKAEAKTEAKAEAKGKGAR